MELVNIVSAFLTPIIALVTVSILVLQYKLAKQRWKLDLFEKRYPLFISTMEFIATIVSNAAVNMEQILKFTRESRERDMLFGNDIQQYLDLLEKEASTLSAITAKLDTLDIGDERTNLAKKQIETVRWFENQLTITKNLFGEYIKIDEK